jgi:UDP-hydrolysing UDP-N-acetyl-D-glucosamine 2-epimerase|tara:strand:- start:2326 stop:3456 length:1131 start_codon:yes stop_codon:yes gene_type:complete
MKKVLLIFESRASYGYSKNLYNLLKKDNNFQIRTLVTGTHLSKELGSSIKNLNKDKIKIDFKINFENKNFAYGIGKLTIKFCKILKNYKPNIVIIFGDRVELMSFAIGCSYNQNIILAHIQAGDRSGHIDDMTRMALAKMAHIHFPATKKAYNRLIRLGEEKKRIFLVGAPQLDDINYKNLITNKSFFVRNKKINIDEKYLVVLQHSVFKDQKIYEKRFSETLKACQKFNYKKYIIYPNYDPGYKAIISSLNKIRYNKKKIIIFRNLDRSDFLKLVANSSALVGNSSAGILESPSLKIGVVNIGDRQNFRERCKNIYDADYNHKDIYKKIKKAVSIKHKIKNIKNLHGDGKSSQRIYSVLKKIKIDNKILIKNTTY